MLHGINSSQVQQLILDFFSVVNGWEASGGGEFDTGGLVMNTIDPGGFAITMEKTAVGDFTFYSKQTARS